MTEIEEKRATYPRVSDILSKVNRDEYQNIAPEVLAKACLRGTKVHEYCSAVLNNLWIPEIEEEYQPYVNAFEQWASEYVVDTKLTNMRLYDDELMYTGEFDLIVKLKDRDDWSLLDIKTSSSVSKTWLPQLAAYDHLCQVNKIEVGSCFNLHLKRKAPIRSMSSDESKETIETNTKTEISKVRPLLILHKNITAGWDIFASALRCYDHFHRKEVV